MNWKIEKVKSNCTIGEYRGYLLSLHGREYIVPFNSDKLKTQDLLMMEEFTVVDEGTVFINTDDDTIGIMCYE